MTIVTVDPPDSDPVGVHAFGARQRAVAITVLLCLLAGATVARPPHSVTPIKAPFGIEVIVRTAENFHNVGEVKAFIELAATNHVKAVNLLVKQDEDARIASGEVFYASRIAPRAAGYETFDVLQAMLDATRGRGIEVRAWVPQFHDRIAASKGSGWPMMATRKGQIVPYTGDHDAEYFANPLSPDVQAYELSILSELAQSYAIDGVMLDWIRFDNFNMDLSARTRERYQSLANIDPATIDFAGDSAERARWNEFRTDAIGAYAKTLRERLAPQLSLGVYVLPPEFTEVGQDAAKFNTAVGSLSPMCYFRDWGYPIEWIWSSCLARTVAKAGGASVVPAMDSQLTDTQYRQIFDHLRADFPQIRTLAWFHHGTWTPGMFERIATLSRE
jgi:Putative glycosyl hydrolase domain